MNAEITNLLKEKSAWEFSYLEYNRITEEIRKIRETCGRMSGHSNSYRIGETKEEHEGRIYDVNRCDNCGEVFETRSYAWHHDFPSEEEFMANKMSDL